MIDIKTANTSLDLNISLSDVLYQFFRYEKIENTQFHYHNLTMKKQIGTALEISSLIQHPKLCQQLRKVEHGKYLVHLNLEQINTLQCRGIDAVIDSLSQLKKLLTDKQQEKASLDAVIYNLIGLYGSDKKPLVLQSIKPYYYNRAFNRSSPYKGIQANISGVRYNFSHNGYYKRHKSPIYSPTANDLLAGYYLASKDDPGAPAKSHLNLFIGGFLKTPIFAFRMRNDWGKRGKKYYIDLKTNQAYTKIVEAKKIARQYCDDTQLTILEN